MVVLAEEKGLNDWFQREKKNQNRGKRGKFRWWCGRESEGSLFCQTEGEIGGKQRRLLMEDQLRRRGKQRRLLIGLRWRKKFKTGGRAAWFWAVKGEEKTNSKR